ncbi:hypothetical protein CHRYSEOSP005_11750 [Chryseobacterium sp. Alg-005]|uniref:DNA translocase FtsK n=1 Tax=Chryseobacterium sp. Alg-005 TaxID=3159516 RepID=UPI0035556749
MSIYKSYTPEQLESHNSNYLINSWSYSKLMQFSRNEKAFEMIYIYGYRSKSTASTVAGKAYHYALQHYFNSKKEGNPISIVDAEILAFNFIDEVPANDWKIQKTTPSVEDCKIKATRIVNSLLGNFFAESAGFEKDIKEILDVEIYFSEFVTINGVDIPLICNLQIDLVVKTFEDKVAIIDHKSKNGFSTEEELSLSIGKQAMTYVKGYESRNGLVVNEVWFIENKYSKNRDNAPQLNVFKISLDLNTRRLYEALLYEPLKRMIEAVADPDYIFLINDNDSFVDKAEIYEFWAKTQISEIEDFDIEEAKRDLIEKRLKKVKDSSIQMINPKVIKQFRNNASQFIQYDLANKDMPHSEKIEHALRGFNIITKVEHEFIGFSSNTFLLKVSAGVKIASIQSHKLDIANALNVSNVRISKDLTVYDGQSYLGVEISKKRDRDLLWNKEDLSEMKIPIGKDNFGQIIHWDLNNHSTPHILICGATGSGKSVCIESTIEYVKEAGVDRIVIFDPKYEFLKYKNVPGVQVFNEILEIEEEMKNLVDEMNAFIKSGTKQKTLVVFDEFADAVAASRKGKDLDIYEMVQVGTYKPQLGLDGTVIIEPKMKREKTGELKPLEENLRILLQKGRSVGYRIISATQRASTKVITGDAKVNYPVQICFRVPKEIDSRVVIDDAGAETLAGMGDGLIRSPEYPDVVRFQAYYKK